MAIAVRAAAAPRAGRGCAGAAVGAGVVCADEA